MPSVPSTVSQANPSFLNNATAIYVVWKESTGYGLPVSGYEVQVDGSSEWLGVGVSTNYLHSNLGPQQAHTYAVRARNNVGYSASTAPTTLYTGEGGAPGRPTNVRKGSTMRGMNDITAISIVWDPPVSDLPVQYYKIRINRTSEFIIGPGTSWILSDIYPGSSANISVRYVSQSVLSEYMHRQQQTAAEL